MRKIVYQCDHCTETLSDGFDVAKPHISLNMVNGQSGWVKPEKASMRLDGYRKWNFTSHPERPIMQFCDAACLAAYFRKIKNNALPIPF